MQKSILENGEHYDAQAILNESDLLRVDPKTMEGTGGRLLLLIWHALFWTV